MPDLSRWPPTLREEIENATAETQRGREPVAALGRLAALYLANDLNLEAERALRTLLRLDPTNARWPYFLAIVLSRRGESHEAEKLFRDTLTLVPDYAAAQFQLGQQLANTGRDQEARRWYEERLAREPADVLATLGLVDIDRRTGQPDAAIARLERLLQIRPAAAEARLLLAEILDSVGRAAEAAPHRAAAQNAGVATPVKDPWLDEVYLHSFDTFRLQTLGMIRLNAGAVTESLPYLERAAGLAPTDAEIQDSFALALLRIGQIDRARAVLEAAVQRTGAPVIAVRLADTLFAQNDAAAAETVLRKSLTQHPAAAELHEGLGRILLRVQRAAEACDAFRAALRLRPTFTEAQLNLGRALHAAGRPDEARDAVLRALEMRPGWNEALLALGELELAARRWDEATALAERILATNAKSVPTLDLRARAALSGAADALGAGDTAQAEAIYREALARVPENGPLHGALAALLGKLGRLPEAREAADRYTDLSPNDARAWFLLGTVLEQLGNHAEAANAFSRGLDVARATGDTRRAPLLEQALRRLRVP